MEILPYGTLILLFIVSIVCIELVLYAFRTLWSPERRKVRKRLKTVSSPDFASEAPDILRKTVFSSVPSFNEFLKRFVGLQHLDLLIRQANVQYPVGVFILLSVVLAFAGILVSFFVTGNYVIALIVAGLCGAIPFVYLVIKKKRRMQKFQRQLPEGLELIGRALRAGHAFTSGVKLAADQFGDPLGPEFAETLDEINFGVSVPEALKNLAQRIDCPDLKYFVISVIIQREVGGNLAEIIDSIALIVRERFKFKDKVRVLSAEAKLSARILIALPFFIIVALRVLNPDYISTLVVEPMGRMLCAVGAVLMIFGIVVIMKMVRIKV